MFKFSLAVVLILASATFAYAQGPDKVHQPTLTPQTSGTTQLLIAVSPVDDQVVWAAGTGGTYVVTTDGGNTWKAGVVPGTESLQFRDVQGVSDKIAYLLSIGNNTTDFRIYKTETAAPPGSDNSQITRRMHSTIASHSGLPTAALHTAIP